MKHASLRRRLATLIVGGSIVASVIAAAGFSWLDWKRIRESSQAHVAALGAIVADQAAPAISLQDHKAASEILNSLRADALIGEAALYDKAGECFASYRRVGAAPCPPVQPDGVRRRGGGLVLARPVTEGPERTGTLTIAASAPSM